MNRREFLQSASLASAALLLPKFLNGLGQRTLAGAANGRKLVIVQLSGGNDGLNTVIPFGDDLYYRARPVLGIPKVEVLALNNHQGLHPAMPGLHRLFQDGRITLLNGVGYPNPDRSHFRSMDIWHTASDSDVYSTTGWLGRYLDAACAGCPGHDSPHAVIETEDTLSLALKGATRSGFAVTDPARLFRSTQTGIQGQLVQEQVGTTGTPELDFLYKTAASTYRSAHYLQQQVKTWAPKTEFPASPLGRNLRLIASLIGSGVDTSVYYCSLPGFDTHVNQPTRQRELLQMLDLSLSAFLTEMKALGMDNDVRVLVFSEFGRRVAENGSRGTDHGTANNVWLLGGNLPSPGIHNAAPDLTNLDTGDLRHQLDFRQVYATLLHDWLRMDDAQILGKRFERLRMV